MASITTPEFWQVGSAGTLGPSCEIKLVDQPELGYLSSNSPPQGEIWLRGPNIFKGYYKQPDLTREALTSDGWFKTGDIGQFEPDGTLTIIDRVKNLVCGYRGACEAHGDLLQVKLSNGEYIALDKLESIYKSCGEWS